ncbi:MAG: DsbC family protein [Burkholderiaceae bacterium]|jgi:thiol:disulfide interchange protein DsbC|nr:DsbC family protein [Burkholderiaceae bacterium]
MNSWMRHASVLVMALVCSAAWSQTPAPAATAAGSAEAQVAARFAEKSGGTKPDKVFTSLGGLYEVLIGGELYYVDAGVNFVIAGRMFDATTREDLTQKRLDVALKVDFKSLPLDRAIKTKRGDGSRIMVTFEDPNCPYCKRLWQNMQEMKNVTIYTFLYPILSAESNEKSRAIWCSKDRAVAWDQYMVGGKVPAAAAPDCKNPLEQNIALGRQLGITGTPTIVFADGSRAAGALPIPMIEQRIAAAKK